MTDTNSCNNKYITNAAIAASAATTTTTTAISSDGGADGPQKENISNTIQQLQQQQLQQRLQEEANMRLKEGESTSLVTTAALVGELVVDEPPPAPVSSSTSSNRSTASRIIYTNAKRRQILLDMLKPTSARSLRNNYNSNNNNNNTTGSSGDADVGDDGGSLAEDGILSSARKWWQKQKERYDHEDLQRQVDYQREQLSQTKGIFTTQTARTRNGVSVLLSFPSELRASFPSLSTSSSRKKKQKEEAAKKQQQEELEQQQQKEEEEDGDLIPPIRIEPDDTTSYPFVLSTDDLQRIAQEVVPPSTALCRWSRIYSLVRDGDSFDSAFFPKVEKHQNSLIIVRTTTNKVFGGFAASPWQRTGASFYGNGQSSLFSFAPGDNDDASRHLSVYRWSGANRYIQLCDLEHKMLAFGGGGTDGSFGLCLVNDFQHGSTGVCDTFRNEPLCSEGNFEIVDVEVWGFVRGKF